MDLNKVMIIGRLTRDPEIRTTTTGQNVASFSVATSFNWTDQQGQKKEQTEFHNVVAWRKLADIVGQYLKKGSQVYLGFFLLLQVCRARFGFLLHRYVLPIPGRVVLSRSYLRSSCLARDSRFLWKSLNTSSFVSSLSGLFSLVSSPFSSWLDPPASLPLTEFCKFI